MPTHKLARLDFPARHLRLLQALLAQYVPHAQVWAYGSRINGQAHEGSDLDIVLRNPANLAAETPERYALKRPCAKATCPCSSTSTTGHTCPPSFIAILKRITCKYRVKPPCRKPAVGGCW